MECQYCQTILGSKISLTRHQKTTKSCLVIQGKGTDLYKCPCGAAFSIKSSFVRHQVTCGLTLKEQVRTSGTELEEAHNTNRELREQLRESQNEINRLQAITEKLETKLETAQKINEHYFKLTETLAAKPTNTIKHNQ